MDSVGRHGSRFQAEGLAVESPCVIQSAGWHEEVDVGDAGDHVLAGCWRAGGDFCWVGFGWRGWGKR